MEPQSSGKARRTPADFDFRQEIGQGSYATVVLAVERATDRQFAVKVLDKHHIVKEKKVSWVNREKEILDSLRHANIITLYYTFQDIDNLYFVLEYCPNGELGDHIKKLGALSMECTRFYAAELVSALSYLSEKGVIHRDIKPENLLLDPKFHLKIIDFGTAKVLGHERNARAYSFCGTAEYVPPELLADQYTCSFSDLWALGCCVYHFLAGRPPFRGPNDYHVFQMVRNRTFTYPEPFSPVAKDLIEKLLVMNPEERLGAGSLGITDIMQHPFFSSVTWATLHTQTPPPLAAPASLPQFPLSPPSVRSAGAESDGEGEEGRNGRTQRNSGTTNHRQSFEIIGYGPQRQARLEQQQTSPWSPFLIPNSELLVETGLVWKKKGLFSRKRQLVLTDRPRLFYVDSERMVFKGEVPWSDKLFPYLKSPHQFHIYTPGRTYVFDDVACTAQQWVDSILTLKSRTNSKPLSLSDQSA